jgi:hypothetical protein
MTPAARSIYIFGLYLVVLGAILIGTPNTLLALVRIQPTTEPWIRVAGVPIMAMGMLFLANARAEQTAFMRTSVWVRLFPVIAFIVFALLKIVPPVVVLFGVVDAAAAAWTYMALRAQPEVAAVQR